MSTHNLCFEQKYEKYQNFLSENFHFLVVKFSLYLNRHVFVINIWIASSEKEPLNMGKMHRFRSSCACTKYHPGLFSPS